ncbi:MAG: hypothetical protein GX207_08205 [Peptococcaceae bacterium]|nr:hypothetical protein [Peptococcaceae bacterium]
MSNIRNNTDRLIDWTKTKKTITDIELQKLFHQPDYQAFYNLITELLTQGVLEPVKASGQNGRFPALFNKYRIKTPPTDYEAYHDQIRCLAPALNIAAYLQKPEYYLKHQDLLEGLSKYLWDQPSLLKQPMSRKERSFSIWGKEKMLDGHLPLVREVLRFNGLPEDFLNYYDTPEPFFDYVRERSAPMTILIVENKDTWFTLRKLMQETEKSNLAGTKIQVLIYGEGNKITKPGALTGYLKEMYGLDTPLQAHILYFGDIDYEGIRLYYRTGKANSDLNILPFSRLYQKMIQLAAGRDLPCSPDTRQIEVDLQDFLNKIGLSPAGNKLEFLQRGRYIPQEILNYQILAEMLE